MKMASSAIRIGRAKGRVKKMTATVEKEPTHLINHERGICLHKQARFRFGKYKNFRVRDVWEAAPEYLNWLAGQEWFIEKHQTMVTLDDEPESLPPAPASREVSILAGGCALIRPAAWGAR
jgi:hypothetical protein